MITYDEDELKCSGISNTNEEIDCVLQRGFLTDTVILSNALRNTEGDLEDEEIDRSIIESGSQISFRVGPITNPISAAPVPGFQIETVSSDGGRIGNIAIGFGSLTVSEPAEVANFGSAISLEVTSTPVNALSTFTIEVDLPLPLN